MLSLRDIPIKGKLSLLILASASVVLLLAYSAFFIYEIIIFQKQIKIDLSTLAEVIGPNCSAALDFRIPAEAEEALAALRLEPRVISAVIYQDDGSVFASYIQRGKIVEFPKMVDHDGFYFSVGGVDLFQEILSDELKIGTLYLRSDYRGITSRLKAYVLTALSVLAAAYFATFLISTWFQRIISMPIIDLAHTAKSISANNDYTLQARKFGKDELGEFTDAFNHMISQIRKQDDDLRDYQNELEKKVEERTNELSRTNQHLTTEIGERRQAEAALAEEKQRLAVTLRSIGDGVIATDVDGRVVLLNNAAEKLIGSRSKDVLNKPLSSILRIDDTVTIATINDLVKRALKSGNMIENPDTIHFRNKNIRLSGAPIMDNSGNVIGVVLIFRDATTREMLEEERFRSSKLESIGLLAGGIAHDFNNILTAILGNISLAKRSPEDSEKLYQRLGTAEKATQRAQALTQQLLTFAKGGSPVLKLVSIRQLIMESADFVLIGTNVRCQYELPDDLWTVKVDSGQMSQVINNLVINAQQAMPTGGVITIRANNVAAGSENVNCRLPANSGDFIRIIFEDHGNGIPPGNLANIFDPYFTTKQKGSGLGLATTYSIIRNHDGYLTVESTVGSGTSFFIYLPALPQHADCQVVDHTPLIRGHGRILVMDDDDFVREVSGEMLTELGYQADFAVNGDDAIKLFQDAKSSMSPYAGVILDLTIPGGMGGSDVIQRLMKLDPHVRSIVSSGYSNDPITANFQEYGFSGVLPKPFDIHDLSTVLHQVIANGQSA